ncbi:MAG: hypothetical protein OHK0012_04840 [Synechococcales cyanobacterium]
MAKKRNLKKEKAERNREYARQFQKSRTRNTYRRSFNTSADDENPGGTSSSSADEE